ncbi:hypothetical protein [Rhodococcus sp. ARC_M6]|uniref:hypothetical protein n=1 Tax=Rhodococcus sp. ARC_M6 TaxID=2928852 RepID=UPI001FB4240E|nr:hypothetical protein [Rhodococcus sp. ARC_M6]MCJ0907327.1 hypothetical protein [Rhodococcus sp. ARC_M6]
MSGKRNWMVLDGFEKGGAWHYTNLAGLQGIAKNHCLWSTARAGLNDPLEVTYALEEMRRTWQHYRDSSKLAADVPREAVDDLVDRLSVEIESVDLFFTSGSMDGDKLEHWKCYGSDQGYSICFQDCSTWRLRSYDETAAKELEPTSPFLRWREVDYTKFEPSFSRPLATSSGRALEEIIRAAVGCRDGAVAEQQGHQYALDEALRQLCWHKHTGYESEEEIRIAVQDPPSATRRTRRSAYGPRTVEYVELVAADPMAPGAAILAAGEPVPLLPIMAVRIGPRNTPTELAEDLNAIARLLDENGYDVPVLASPTPFLRGR